MAHPYQSEADASHRRALQRCAGGGAVEDEKQDKKLVAKGVHQHENHEHEGKHTNLKLASGGKVPGAPAKGHLGKMARGGRTKGPARVNIVISTGGGEGERQMAMRQGLQLGAQTARQGPPMPPRPPMLPPGAGMAPPGAPPPGMPPGAGMPPPRPPMKSGGAVYPHPGVGGGGGEARLMKDGLSRVSVKAHTRRRAGGRVDE